MDANELRALQAPLKKQYREQPATALTPARAEAMLDMDRIVCRVRSWGRRDRRWPVSGHRRRREPCLLRGYDAGGAGRLAGVTVSAVATAMCVKLRGGGLSRRATGTRAARWAWIAKRRSASTDIALTSELDTDADTATMQRVVEMSERFCVIYQTLRAPPGLRVTHRTAAGA